MGETTAPCSLFTPTIASRTLVVEALTVEEAKKSTKSRLPTDASEVEFKVLDSGSKAAPGGGFEPPRPREATRYTVFPSGRNHLARAELLTRKFNPDRFTQRLTSSQTACSRSGLPDSEWNSGSFSSLLSLGGACRSMF